MRALMLDDNSAGLSLDDAVKLAQHGTSLFERYQNSDVLAELGEGIDAVRKANEYLPENHPLKVACLNNLGNAFEIRFQRLHDLADLHEAISAQLHIVRLTPAGDPEKPHHLSILGKYLHSRFERLGSVTDLD